MKKILIAFLIYIVPFTVFAQTEGGSSLAGRELYNNARSYLQKADYANAIMVYHQAIQTEPENLVYRRELAHAYYLQGDMLRGEKMISPLLKVDTADEETFLVASRIYTVMKRMDDAKDAINKGISKYPNSGILYASKGDLYTTMKRYKDASEAWEKGIEMSPTYYLNYYNLAKVYYFTKKYLWAINYGETFVNLESFSSKTEEIKKIVFESYKFLLAELNNVALDGKINRFEDPKNYEEASLGIFNSLRNVVTGGMDVDNITMLRTRFLLEWNKKYAKQYPLELFDFQQKMIQKGYYDAYNQWLFGRLDNEKMMKSWTQKHATLMNQFDTYFRNQKLSPQLNQYYKSK